jgi:hypothetical protein
MMIANTLPASCPGLSRTPTFYLVVLKTWMAGTRPAMTNDSSGDSQ